MDKSRKEVHKPGFGRNLSGFFKTLGPGLLFAGTAIGVSHLVQSTRAGAEFEMTLLWAVIAANILKYPFFEFGSRYANVKGESLITGYYRMGKAWFGLYVMISLGTAFFVCAAVGIVTAGFLTNLLVSMGITCASVKTVMISLLILGPGLLVMGKFTGLLKSMKVLGTVMVICTTIAFVAALIDKGPSSAGDWTPMLSFDTAGFAFLLALMGWMPTAVDLSAWNSIWTVERIRDSGFKPTLKQTLFEFRLGYWVSGILAVMFVFLGAAVLRQSGSFLSDNSGTFAGQVVEVFALTIGSWSWPIMALAGFSIMFGTLIAVFDGYGRCLRNSFLVISTGKESGHQTQSKNLYVFFVWLTAIASWLLLYLTVFRAESPVDFKALVDLATTLSFLVAPLIAVLNHALVTRKEFPSDSRPGVLLKTTSLLGIIFLAGFAVIYVLC